MSTARSVRGVGVAPIATPRLVLRPFEAGDLVHLQRIVSAPSVRAVSPEEPRAIGAAERAEQGRRRRAPGAYEFAIVVRRTGRVAGACELILGPGGSGEIGYLLGPRHWGRGYATEVAEALVVFGLDGLSLRRIHATVTLDNPRSRRVLQKAGFAWDAFVRRSGRAAGRSLDTERYVYVGDNSARTACRSRPRR
jgi:RimJ/RimL family protein N-acetyltransferase